MTHTTLLKYRPPRERNENYQSFINELVPIFYKLDNNKCEIVLTDDFNINLLKKRPGLIAYIVCCSYERVYLHLYFDTILNNKLL